MEINPNQLAGQPVRSLQNYLRQISFAHDIPRVVPDGIYGPNTAAAVARFQELFGLPVTGEADEATWNAIVEEGARLLREGEDPEPAHIFPSAGTVFEPGDAHPSIAATQHMLSTLADRFNNLPRVELTGVMDPGCCNCLREVQRVAGLPQTGKLDKKTWNAIAALYHAFVNVFE